MKQSLSQNKIFTQTCIAIGVFASRLSVLPANISPLGSFGFFGNPILFIVSIVAFDLFVKGVYPGVFFTYLGFAMYPLLKKIAGKSVKKQMVLLPLASFLFFVFSNFGVWWYWYDHTIEKLIMCYALAVPFYARTLLSDMFFGYSYLFIKQFRQISARVTARLPLSDQFVLK